MLAFSLLLPLLAYAFSYLVMKCTERIRIRAGTIFRSLSSYYLEVLLLWCLQPSHRERKKKSGQRQCRVNKLRAEIQKTTSWQKKKRSPRHVSRSASWLWAVKVKMLLVRRFVEEVSAGSQMPSWRGLDFTAAFDFRLSGIKGVEAGSSAPVSKEYGKFQPLCALCLPLSRNRLSLL